MKGLVQVYTGNGKGKSTAAFGLALRAAGAGLKVFVAQFTKGSLCSEHQAFKAFPNSITVRQYGSCEFIDGKPSKQDICCAHAAFEDARVASLSHLYDLIILDEINIAVHLDLISIDTLIDLLNNKPDNLEIVCTGRYAHQLLIEKADLVTEMKEVKHYYSQGIHARKGIEF